MLSTTKTLHENKYVLSLALKPATVLSDLMSKGRAFQGFGGAFI